MHCILDWQVDEVNLVYVACTRAKTQLILNQDLSRLLDKSWHPSILDCASLEALPYLEARWLPRALLRTCDPTQDLAPHLSNVCTICNRTSSFKQSTVCTSRGWYAIVFGDFASTDFHRKARCVFLLAAVCSASFEFCSPSQQVELV